MNMCDTNPAALLRAQITCVYVTFHLIHSQQIEAEKTCQKEKKGCRNDKHGQLKNVLSPHGLELYPCAIAQLCGAQDHPRKLEAHPCTGRNPRARPVHAVFFRAAVVS